MNDHAKSSADAQVGPVSHLSPNPRSALRATWLQAPNSLDSTWPLRARAVLRSLGFETLLASDTRPAPITPTTLNTPASAAPRDTVDVMFIEYPCAPQATDASPHARPTQDAPWLRAWRAARAANKHTLGVLVVNELSPAALKLALSERMADVLRAGDDIELRLISQRLAKRIGERRDEVRRIAKLRRKCDKLEASRRELLRQIGGLCDGVVSAYTTAAKGMKLNSMSADLTAILRQELDIENLLRLTLEYTLKKLGSTNGAIFLPSACGDYTLGAYVNYDLPRDSAETLMTTLADSLAPRSDHDTNVTLLHRARDLDIDSISSASWINDQTITVQACHHAGERLAVMTFFRDTITPFTPEHIQSLEIIGAAFSRQLARVVATHHRHKPKHSGFGGWSDLDNPTSEAA